MKSRRTMRAEAIASFESSILQRDALDAEIDRVGQQYAALKHQRDHLATTIDTLCRLLNWTPESAEESFRRKLATDAGTDQPKALSLLPLLDRKREADDEAAA